MLDIKVNKQEVYRYLGYTSNMQLSNSIVEQIDKCILEVLSTVTPRTVYSSCLDISRDNELKVGNMQLLGTDIALHLKTSSKAILIAVTLGSSADMLIKRAELLDITSAVIIDAICNVVVDQVADELEDKLRAKIEELGFYLTGRYSPGYGDLPLDSERELLAILDAEKRVGITLTENNLMIPKKSITAILGVSKTKFTGRKAGCEHCLLQGKCDFRKRGTTCNG